MIRPLGERSVWECLHLSDYISQRRKTSTKANVCECMLNCFSRIRLCTVLWTVAYQAPLSMGFSRQEYWSGLACPPPRAVPNPGIELASLTSPALACGFFTPSTTMLNSIWWLRQICYLMWGGITNFTLADKETTSWRGWKEMCLKLH